jgi:hypothetical protein
MEFLERMLMSIRVPSQRCHEVPREDAEFMEDAGPPRSIMLTNGQHLPGGAMLGGPYHPCILKFLNF